MQSVASRQISHVFMARPLLYRRATSVIWRGAIWRPRLRRLAAAANVSYLAIDIRVFYQGSAERQKSMQKCQRGAAGGNRAISTAGYSWFQASSRKGRSSAQRRFWCGAASELRGAASGAKPSFVPKPHVVMKQGMSNRQHINQRSPKSAFCNPSAAQITTVCI